MSSPPFPLSADQLIAGLCDLTLSLEQIKVISDVDIDNFKKYWLSYVEQKYWKINSQRKSLGCFLFIFIYYAVKNLYSYNTTTAQSTSDIHPDNVLHHYRININF